ncbi:MAG: hypothetical protein WBD01_10000 [Salaquimonas sp.]
MMEPIEHTAALFPQTELRSPDEVMKLDRLGSFYPTRLSFMRTTIRRLANENVKLRRSVWEIDKEGFGRAVYTLSYGGHLYSLIAFSTRIDPNMRTDRVIAEVWDSAYVLFDGVPTTEDLDRLEQNAPRQEAGRFLPSELVLSRANRSVRLFDHVAQSLAAGKQPDEKMIGEIGYLMRTTAVYGNGKFGIADRARIMARPGLSGPFQAEMLTVWLIRNFTHDLVEHVAHSILPDMAVKLDKRLKRHLGIGNSTGLGMAPFLVSHPILLNNWMMVRETALARVAAIAQLDAEKRVRLERLVGRVTHHLKQWNVPDIRQSERIELLKKEWGQISPQFSTDQLKKPNAVSQILEATKAFSLEAQELVIALLLEPHGDLIDGLTDCMASDVESRLDPAMSVGALQQAIENHYAWALKIDCTDPSARKQFWYVSEEKLEPRLGDRFEEEGAELELPHDIAVKVQALEKDLAEFDTSKLTAEFLMRYPQHRYIVRRIQTTNAFPYAEIRDNLVGEKCLPIDMLRCKLSFFGAAKFDPKSSRWTRITMYQGAPLAEDITNAEQDCDDWWLPVLEEN